MATRHVDARLARLYPFVVVAAMVVGLGLRLPALYNGLASDDFVEAAMLDGVYPSPRGPFDLFNFTDGTPEEAHALMGYGALPWWTVPGLRLAMMRPLASALVVFDLRVLGGDPFLRHLHSAFWWLATLGVAAMLLRRLLRPAVASLAIVLFALEEGHTLPLAWLANRGALVAMTLGLLALLAHLRYRVDGWEAGRRWVWALVCLALTAGEWAFPILGYLVAYEVFGATGSIRARVRALLPALVPGLVFVLLRATLGYGAQRSGVYIDPITEPWAFAVACTERLPVFFADLLFSVPAMWWDFGSPWRDTVLSLGVIPLDLWIQLPGWRTYHWMIGVAAMLLSVAVVRWGLRGASERDRRQLGWMLPGALLSLVPMVASFPTSRLVLPASVAASGLAAAVIVQGGAFVVRRGGGAMRRAAVALVVVAMAWLQVIEAGRTSLQDTLLTHYLYASTQRTLDEAEMDVEGIEAKRVILLSSDEHTVAVFTPFARWVGGAPMPRSFWTLSAAPQAFDLYRPKANVLELQVIAGTLLGNDMERLYRSDKYPLRVGAVVAIDGLRVEILRVMDGRPQRVRFVFERSLDDPGYLVLNTTLFGVRRAAIPEVGQRRRYKRPALPDKHVLDVALSLVDVNSACLVRPPLLECRYGHAFADCGGTGDPVFACHGFSDCRWFVGGCVADGYISSSCDADNLCCYDGWPFDAEDEVFATGGLRSAVGGVLAGWGREPPALDRAMNLHVEEDPGLAASEVGLTCHGAMGHAGPCDYATVRVLPYHFASFALAFEPVGSAGRWGLTLEAMRDRRGRLSGRVCKIPIALHEAGVCPAQGPPDCAPRGEIVLDVLAETPDELRSVTGRFFADFGGGRFVYGAF